MSGDVLRPFHLAIVVDDLSAARSFCGGLLGCAEGRSSAEAGRNIVDGHRAPVPHFGLVLDIPAFETTRDQLFAK